MGVLHPRAAGVAGKPVQSVGRAVFSALSGTCDVAALPWPSIMLGIAKRFGFA
jgi:hypothetical protein